MRILWCAPSHFFDYLVRAADYDQGPDPRNHGIGAPEVFVDVGRVGRVFDLGFADLEQGERLRNRYGDFGLKKPSLEELG